MRRVLMTMALTAALAVAGSEIKTASKPKDPTAEDRDRVRQLQVQAWQTVAEVQRVRVQQLEAEKRLDEINRQLEELTRQLVTTYRAEGYLLSQELKWVKPPAPPQPQSPPEEPAQAARASADGAGEDKK